MYVGIGRGAVSECTEALDEEEAVSDTVYVGAHSIWSLLSCSCSVWFCCHSEEQERRWWVASLSLSPLPRGGRAISAATGDPIW